MSPITAGQIVGYMFIDLHNHGRDICSFVHNLEQVFINLLAQYYQIKAFRDPTHTGVWVDGGKITAIGLAIKRWVTMHGFAFNEYQFRAFSLDYSLRNQRQRSHVAGCHVRQRV